MPGYQKPLLLANDGHSTNKPQPQAMPPQRQPQQHPTQSAHPEQGPVAHGEWVQPPDHVVRSRALRRFWTAFFWAWLIWTVIGLIIGGGVSDVENNRHWHKHQKWDKPPGSY
ncbi:hypothetical protein L198_03877 [Cryptococcus wingfieldii CBS 7118]|nr:hypothetical protein L198_03877 [Cryptococcus wingfieldii CBS 7118]ODN97314.1 hypothetical protein L198_03877 [Cryptococcus wingfieldii CBS 7118]